MPFKITAIKEVSEEDFTGMGGEGGSSGLGSALLDRGIAIIIWPEWMP